MAKKNDGKELIQVRIHCVDLSTHELNNVPQYAETIYDITKDVMKYGAYCYNNDVAHYIPPQSIASIEYIKGVVGKEEEEEEEE